MSNAKHKMKELARAIDIITEFRESDQASESEIVMAVLKDAELDWRVRYMDLQTATVRKPTKKNARNGE